MTDGVGITQFNNETVAIGPEPKKEEIIQVPEIPSEFNEDGSIPERAYRNKCFYLFYKICTHDSFTYTIMVLILFNTLILSIDRYPISVNEFEVLE